MNGDEFNSINRSLGNIEGEMKSQGKRVDGIIHGLFDEGGLQSRVSKLEIAIAVIKGNRALVITLISLVAGMAGFFIFLFGTGVAK